MLERTGMLKVLWAWFITSGKDTGKRRSNELTGSTTSYGAAVGVETGFPESNSWFFIADDATPSVL